jgi:hypothetical protein
VEVHWYDGGIKPVMPNGWPAGKNMNDSGGAAIFYGTKDTLICGCYGVRPWLLSGRVPANVPQTQRVVPGTGDTAHTMDWVRACKENPNNRTETASNFNEAGPFNEMVVMGVLAVRLQGLNKELLWNGEKMEFTNIDDKEEISIVKSDDFKIEDGHPSFNKPSEKVNAKVFAQELIKRPYREGWSLPAMP